MLPTYPNQVEGSARFLAKAPEKVWEKSSLCLGSVSCELDLWNFLLTFSRSSEVVEDGISFHIFSSNTKTATTQLPQRCEPGSKPLQHKQTRQEPVIENT